MDKLGSKNMASTSKKPAEDLSNVEFETSEDVEVVPTFQSMKLREELLRGIYAYGENSLFNIKYSSHT
jgi:hypothetical protein